MALVNQAHYFAKLDTTMMEAKRRLTFGAPCPRLIIAKTQSEGRGRYGRVWFSPPGNLYMSCVEPVLHPMNHQPFFVGVALAETLKKFIKTPIALKEPNDVLVEGRKIAGILIEQIDQFYIIGIGINVASSPLVQKYETTHVHAINPHVSIPAILHTFLKNFPVIAQLSFEVVQKRWCNFASEYDLKQGDMA